MVKTAEFGQPTDHSPQPGRCRICRSTDPDTSPGASLNWADETRTLCALPECVAAARAELTTRPLDAEALLGEQTGPRYGFAPQQTEGPPWS
jgi:hypothetical protein